MEEASQRIGQNPHHPRISMANNQLRLGEELA
jgi:hypothetical protein